MDSSWYAKAHWEFGSLGPDHPMHTSMVDFSKSLPRHLLRSPGTKMEPSESDSTMAQPLLCHQKNMSSRQYNHPRRENASMIHLVSLSRGSQQLDNPLCDQEAIIGKLLENKYSHTPWSPLQRAWSWWTWLGLNHEEQNIFGYQVPQWCVLRIAFTVKGTRFVPTPEYIHPMDFAC